MGDLETAQYFIYMYDAYCLCHELLFSLFFPAPRSTFAVRIHPSLRLRHAFADPAFRCLLGMCTYPNRSTLFKFLTHNLQMLSLSGTGPLACLGSGVLYNFCNFTLHSHSRPC